MRYLEFTFKLTPQSSDFEDVFIDLLGEIGFDSFVKSTAPDEQMKGYIPVKDFRETDLKNCIADFPLPDVDISYTYQEAEDKDWNEVWEKNYFEPLVIGGWEIYHRLLTTFSERLKKRGLGVALGMCGSQRILVLPEQDEVTKE